MSTPPIRLALLVNQLGNGGAERVVSLLANHLDRRVIDVCVLCIEKNAIGNDNFYQIPSDIPIYYLDEQPTSNSGFVKLLEIPLLAWKLSRFIRQHKIQVVQSHLFRASYANLLAKQWLKLTGHAHQAQVVFPNPLSHYDKAGTVGKVNLKLIQWLYPLADQMIFKSIEMQQQANQRFTAFRPVAQTVIYNPYNLDEIQQKSQAAINFTFDDTKRYLVTVGRLIKLKRLEVIFAALKQLPENIELILVGNGQDEDDYRQQAETMGLSQRVHFVGAQKNPFAWVAKADLFILASESEGFPNVLAEAMACGTAVVASDCTSGPREILAPNTNPSEHLKVGDTAEATTYGLLYAVGDSEQLALGIQQCLNDTTRNQHCVQAAQQRVQDFSLPVIMQQYQQVIMASQQQTN